MNSPVTYPSVLEVLHNAPLIEAPSHPIVQRFGLPPHPVHIDFGTVTIGDIQYEQPLILRIVNERLELVQCAFMQDRKPVLTYPELNVKGFACFGDLKHDKPVIVTYNLEAFFKIAQTGYAVVLAILPNLCNTNPSELKSADFKKIQLVINQLSNAGFIQIYIPVRPEHIGEPEFQKLAQNTSVKLLNQYIGDAEGSDLIELGQYDDTKTVKAFLDQAIKMTPDVIKNDRVPLSGSISPFGFPHKTPQGKPLNTWENLAYLLSEYGINVRYNVIRKKNEILIPDFEATIDNKQKASLALITSLCAINSMPKTEIRPYLDIIGDQHQYNPVLTWIKSKPWDGISRFTDLCATITPESNYPLKMRDNLIKRWLISAVAAASNSGGFESHGALVLVGGQGLGKTTWFNKLVTPDLRRELVLTGALIDTDNKDTTIRALSHWIVELGELDATFKRSDIAKLKAFITQGVDKFRKPFEQEDDERDRRTVFCASVNQSDYLVDTTGNRRWWTIPCTAINYTHDIDIQQVWAEVYEWLKNGEVWHLTHEEQAELRAINESHEQIDPITEKIIELCSSPDALHQSKKWMIAGDVLISLGYRTPNKAQRNIASKALRDLGIECRTRHKVQQYLVPMKHDPGDTYPF